MPPLWIKCPLDMPSDPKLFSLPVWQRHLWLCLRCTAKKYFGETGIIRGYSAGDFARLYNLGVPAAKVKKALQHFAEIDDLKLGADGAIEIIGFLDENGPGYFGAQRDRKMGVYFIRDEGTGRIKIGTSKNPWARLAELQRSSESKLTLVAVHKEGGFELESSLHRRFAAARTRGEWFDPVPALLEVVAATVAATKSVAGSRSRYGSPGEGEGDQDQDLDTTRGGSLEASKLSPKSPSPSLRSGQDPSRMSLEQLEGLWPGGTLEQLAGIAKRLPGSPRARAEVWLKFLRKTAVYDEAARVAGARKYLEADAGRGKNLDYLFGMIRGIAGELGQANGSPAPSSDTSVAKTKAYLEQQRKELEEANKERAAAKAKNGHANGAPNGVHKLGEKRP